MLIKIFFLFQKRKLDDVKHMIGIAFRQWKNWSPLYDMCWSRFSFLKNGNSMIWSISVAFHQWKNWSPLYDLCWSIFSFLKDGNSMIWSTWSALPFTSDRTDHHLTICADQYVPSSKDGNLMIRKTWSAAPFTSDRTDLRFTFCADQDCPSSKKRKLDELKHMIGIAFHQWKNWSPLYDMCWSRLSFLEQTETQWFEAHDRHCLSPVKELITTWRYVLIKISVSQRRKLDDLKHMIGVAFHHWKNWSPLYVLCWTRFSCLKDGNSMMWSTWSALPFTNERTDHRFTDMCWSRFSLVKDGNSMIWSTWSALPFTNERTDHHFTICADQDCPSSTDGNSMIWSTWSALPFTNERTDHHFTICADQDFRFSKTDTRWFEAHDRRCLSPLKELITTLRYVVNKIFFLKDGNLMIWSTWSALPFTNVKTNHHFTICAEQDFPLSKTETWWFEAHDRNCLSPAIELITALRYVLVKIFLCQRLKLEDSEDMIGIAFHQWKNWTPLNDICWSRLSFLKRRKFDLKHMIGIAFHQWKNWSPLYDMCWSRLSFLKRRKLDDVKHMIGIAFHQWKNWSPLYSLCWSRLSFLERRKLDDLKHIIGIAFHQWKNWSPLYDMCWTRFPFLKDGNSRIRGTWSALPFTTVKTNHHFTICAEQDFPFSKTETWWFEAHDRNCLSPAIELITALKYVLVKIFLCQRLKLEDSEDMIGIAFHQWKNWTPLYDMCWSRLSFLKNGNSMIWSISVAFHQWKNWSPLYDLCWSIFSFLKDGNSMIWITWSALPFTSDRTDHHLTIFTICADQYFPVSKTETWWFEAHDRHCHSPMKELIAVLRYVLIKIIPSQRRKLHDLKHMIGIAFHQWKNWSPLYDMCWSRLSFLERRKLNDLKHMIDIAFHQWKNWSPLDDTCWSRLSFLKGGDLIPSQRLEAHDRYCLSPMNELITTLRDVLIKIFLSQRRNLDELKHMIDIAFGQWKNWSPLYDMCWSRLSCLKRRKLDDLKHKIGIAFHQWKNWSPLYDMCWSRLSFLNRRKHHDLKHIIGIAFHQWKNWSPLYDLCWSRFSFLKDGNSMMWSTWSALPFTSERTDHHFTICADQYFPFSKTETRWFEAHDRHCHSPAIELITTLRFVLINIFLSQRRKLDDLKHMIGIAFHQWKNWSPLHEMCWSRFSCLKDGSSLIWSTWSALRFTSDRTDHHFTICSDQYFPFSKTETRWFEAHARHCLSPMKELITTLRNVLIKIFPSQRRKLDDLKHMIGIAFHQWKTWSPLYGMCWSRFSFLKNGTSMSWSTWSALPFTSEWTDHHFTICADQDCPSSKDGNSMIWSTWSALPFTNERKDHHLTIRAE